jgi:hypothetical protein
MTEREFQNTGVGEAYTDKTVDLTGLPELIQRQQAEAARKADKAGTLSGKLEEFAEDALNTVENFADRVMRWGGH